ncbi:MAG: DUF167 family protein [Pseudomonadota bacterium]
MGQAAFYRWDGDALVLRVKAQPRASRDEVMGAHGDCWRIRITAPPVDGAANAHLIKFLARLFQVSPAQVTLEGGDTARIKRFRIQSPAVLPEGITRS